MPPLLHLPPSTRATRQRQVRRGHASSRRLSRAPSRRCPAARPASVAPPRRRPVPTRRPPSPASSQPASVAPPPRPDSPPVSCRSAAAACVVSACRCLADVVSAGRRRRAAPTVGEFVRPP
ncbi:Os12g0110550 [Oryza sativa Japonica Group]|uniref:Os12g0110550 protein n=1 Tax=Oryza sativa subsp. japonica TaxID=39947 RepID=A0A0P0Y666_ORYSJ|nr:Os12g0110550 [Oryza sativa Japonica Group]